MSSDPVRAWLVHNHRYESIGLSDPCKEGETYLLNKTTNRLPDCRHGMGAYPKPLDAIRMSSGDSIARVELTDTYTKCWRMCSRVGYLYCREIKVLRVVDVSRVLGLFSRMCALDVVGMWDARADTLEYLQTGSDDRVVNAEMDSRISYRVQGNSGDTVKKSAASSAWHSTHSDQYRHSQSAANCAASARVDSGEFRRNPWSDEYKNDFSRMINEYNVKLASMLVKFDPGLE